MHTGELYRVSRLKLHNTKQEKQKKGNRTNKNSGLDRK